jgi:hypothetical protein
MIDVITGISTFLLSFVIHIIIWRYKLIHRSPKNIIIIFLLCFILVIVLLNIQQIHIFGFIDYIYILFINSALFIAYLFAYPAIESDSPSFLILCYIKSKGKNGSDVNELRRIITDDNFIYERLDGMVRDGLIKLNDDKYILSGSGLSIFRIFKFIRSIYTKDNFGG